MLEMRSRDDEEDVNADETATHLRREGVVGDHQQDRDRSQAVDIGPVSRMSIVH
jgi:hypothetical protein